MNLDHLRGVSRKVFFCLDCDDQAPWIADDIVKCPTCKSAAGVTAAQRFQNLTTEEDGSVRGG